MDLEAYFRENTGIAAALIKAMNEHNVVFKEERVIPEGKPNYGVFSPLFYSKSALLSQDTNQVLNFYNIGAQGVFGYTPQEAIGMKSIELVPPDLRLNRADKFRYILEKRDSIEIPGQRMAKGGKIISINALVFPYETGSGLSISARVDLLDNNGNPTSLRKK